MKAVRQIIDYLRRRGILSREQLVEYAAEGLLRWDEVYEEDEPAEPRTTDEPPVLPEDEDDEDYEATYRPRAGDSRKRRPIHRKGPVLDVGDIRRGIAERFGAWDGPLAALGRIGERLDGSAAWPDAAVVVRNAQLTDLCEVVTKGLEEQDPPLDALWTALALEAYREVVEEEGVHGPAVTAYRAVLSLDEHAQLGRHTWLLREEEVAAVYNLRQAQRRLLLACEGVFCARPDLISMAIRRDYHWLAYWSLVLLHTSRRHTRGERLMPGDHEHRPPRALPSETGWLQAWAHATAMAPPSVTGLLSEHSVLQEGRSPAIVAVLQRLLGSLEERPRQVLNLFYGLRTPQDQIAARLQLPEADVSQDLTVFRSVLRGNLEGHKALQSPHEPDEQRAWEAFLEDCLWWCFSDTGLSKGADTEEFAALIRRHFGPAADLVCPRDWD